MCTILPEWNILVAIEVTHSLLVRSDFRLLTADFPGSFLAPGEDSLRFIHVTGELRSQLIDVGKRLNVTQAGKKVNLKRLPVQRFGAANQMDFGLESMLTKGRIGADIDSSRPRLSVE